MRKVEVHRNADGSIHEADRVLLVLLDIRDMVQSFLIIFLVWALLDLFTSLTSLALR